MEKKTLLICCYLLLIAVILLTVRVYSIPNFADASLVEKFDEQQNLSDPRIILYNNYNAFITENENTRLSDISIVDTNFNYKSLSAIVAKNAKLVIRYSDNDCFDCIRKIINIIRNEHEEKIENVILFTDHEDERDFKIKYKSLATEIEAFSNKKQDSLGGSLDGKGVPYMFVLDPSLTMHNVYVPLKEHPDHINSYITKILSKLTN